MQKIVKKRRGFSILEVGLSIGLIGILTVITIPMYQGVQSRNNLDVAAMEMTQSLRRAQILSQAVDGDTAWGLYVQNGSITLFKGTSYTTRDTDFDETFIVPTNLAFTGLSEIVFTQFSGMPQTTGTITITAPSNETRTVTINAKGMVEY